ncbi:Serine/threonine-protein kinase 10-A [Dirofilaria immitis]
MVVNGLHMHALWTYNASHIKRKQQIVLHALAQNVVQCHAQIMVLLQGNYAKHHMIACHQTKKLHVLQKCAALCLSNVHMVVK